MPFIPGMISYYQRKPKYDAEKTIKHALLYAEVFFLDHPNAVLTIPDLEKNGLKIPADVVVKVIDGNHDTFALLVRTKDKKHIYSADLGGRIKYSQE